MRVWSLQNARLFSPGGIPTKRAAAAAVFTRVQHKNLHHHILLIGLIIARWFPRLKSLPKLMTKTWWSLSWWTPFMDWGFNRRKLSCFHFSVLSSSPPNKQLRSRDDITADWETRDLLLLPYTHICYSERKHRKTRLQITPTLTRPSLFPRHTQKGAKNSARASAFDPLVHLNQAWKWPSFIWKISKNVSIGEFCERSEQNKLQCNISINVFFT